jgi:hypothetical protein
VPRYAFICGCPRSGTTFLATLLNSHPAVAIGIERYGTRFFGEPLTPALFTPERFYDLRPGDTFYDSLDFARVYADKRSIFSEAEVVGDKIPLLFRHLDRIEAAFPGAKVVFCLRNVVDVAASYQARADNPDDATWSRSKGALAAVDDWNASLRAYGRQRGRSDLFVFDYDRFLAEGEAQVRALIAWLGLDWRVEVERRIRGMTRRATELEAGRRRDLPETVLRELLARAAIAPYRAALADAPPAQG